MTKKLGIYLADDTLAYLSLIQTDDGGGGSGISSAVNLAVQSSKLMALQPIRLTPGELLLCCDVLNGGAHLTEFKAPDDVSIRQSLESMRFGLHDAKSWERGIYEKWGVEESTWHTKLEGLTEPELFALAIATRQFWKGLAFGDIKPLTQCGDYQDWAKQWVKGD